MLSVNSKNNLAQKYKQIKNKNKAHFFFTVPRRVCVRCT